MTGYLREADISKRLGVLKPILLIDSAEVCGGVRSHTCMRSVL